MKKNSAMQVAGSEGREKEGQTPEEEAKREIKRERERERKRERERERETVKACDYILFVYLVAPLCDRLQTTTSDTDDALVHTTE